jgi:serine phosphatase RsbU (regulator of sigma subunit)
MLFKKLIFFKKSRWDIIWWNLLQIILFLSLIFCFDWNIPDFAFIIFQVIGGALVVLLSIRLKWIGFLGTQDKLNAILYLVLINLMTIMLLQNFFYGQESNVLITDFNRNTFMLLIGFMVLLYSIFSILALIFNLPTSTVSEQKNTELNSFQELARMQGNLNMEELFEKLFKIALESTQVEGAFLLIDDPKNRYRFYATDNLKGENVKLLKGYCRAEGQNMEEQLLFLNAIIEGDRFSAIRDQYQSVFYQPIVLKDRKIGDLFLMKSFANGFDEYMLRLIKSYTAQLMMTIHNVELLEETIESTRLKEELAIARAVQQKLLPKELPKNDHFEVSAYYLSAHEVGGDYYDYAEVDDLHKLIIADVSGKGTNAAFHVAEMKGVFQALMHLKLSGKEFLNIANQSISKCFDKGIFITLSYLSIDSNKKRFSHSRAGHCPTIYYNAKEDKIQLLDEKGLAFGIIRNDSYANHIEISEHNYNPGDVLLFYTDGILEAREKDGTEEFGFDRIKNLIAKHKNLNTKDILDKIIELLTVFTEGEMSFDDTTLLVVKFK